MATKHEQTNENISIDINYNTLEKAKESDFPIWIKQTFGIGENGFEECESVELSLVQAKWLRDKLDVFIDVLS